MSSDNIILTVALAFLIVIGASFLFFHYFSPEARLERRRRKSYSRIVSKDKRPTVSLSVKTKKD